MKNLLLLFLFILSSSVMIAQMCSPNDGGTVPSVSNLSTVNSTFRTSSVVNSQMLALQHSINTDYGTTKLAYNDIKGTPYLNKDKTEGYLIMNDGYVIENIPLQYDLYTKDIIAENKSGKDIVLDRRVYKELGMKLDGRMIKFKKMNPKEKDKFYEVLYENDNITFYKDHKATIREGQNLGLAKVEPEFRQRINHFIAQKNGSIAKVQLKKKKINSFIAAFPEVEAIAMREYIKKSRIKLQTEKDFVELLAIVGQE